MTKLAPITDEDIAKALVSEFMAPRAPRPIHSSHLALRFYYRDGWTEEELQECVVRGRVYCSHPDDTLEWRYMTLDHTRGSAFNVEKLMLRMSRLIRYSEIAYDGSSDFDYIKGMNW